jgi:hypothetical protein
MRSVSEINRAVRENIQALCKPVASHTDRRGSTLEDARTVMFVAVSAEHRTHRAGAADDKALFEKLTAFAGEDCVGDRA